MSLFHLFLIYLGLACHPHRPFFVASTSRDSTVRFWSLNYFVQKISLASLAYRPTAQIVAKNIGMYFLFSKELS